MLPDGEPLTKTAYERYSPRVAHTTMRRRFGGWREALERAGLGHLYHGQPVSEKMRSQPAKELSNSDLIAELRRVHALVGKDWLTADDFNAHSVTSEEAIRHRFGTFRRGLDAAGIPNHPFKTRQSTNRRCFENIAEVWTHYGRPPTYREMFDPPSRIQGKTYVTRWRTWRKALAAFVEWANADEQDGPESDSALLETTERITQQQLENPTGPRLSPEDRHEVPLKLKWKVHLRDRFRCLACGKSPANDITVELHADHILAWADGGKTVLENLQTLCQNCNLGKGRSFGRVE